MQKLLKIAVFAVCFFTLCFGIPGKADDFMEDLIDDSTELDLSDLQLKPEHHGNKPSPPKPVPEVPNPSTNQPVQPKPPVVRPKPPPPPPPQIIVSGDTNEISQSELNTGIDDSTNSFDISWINVPPPKPPAPKPPQETEIPESDKPATPTEEDPTYGKPVDPSDIPLSLADYLAWLHKIEELYPGYFEDETMFPASKEDVNSTAGIRLQLLTLTTPMHTADWINYWINKLATAAKVESINSVTGAVQLVGKNGIKVEPKANNEIWISSTGGGGGGGSIGVYGVQSPDSDYEYFGNITSLKFNKDSGFSVTPDDQADLLVSLGSSWTELIPDFPAEDKDNLRPSGEEKLSIKATSAEHTGTYWDYSNTNKDKKTFVIGINTAGETAEDITVSSPIGQYTNNAYIPAGTSMNEVFRKMLVKRKTPVQPTLGVTLRVAVTDNGKVEYGYQFPSDSYFDVSFTKNNAGNVTNFTWSVTTNTYSQSSVPTSIDGIASVFNKILKKTYTQFSADFNVGYMQGSIVDPDYPDDRIPAGSKTAQINIIPTRYIYYASMANYIDNENFDPAAVKNLSNKYLANRGSNSQLTIHCSPGDVQISIAIPLEIITKISKVMFRSQQGSMILEYEVTDEMKIVEIPDVFPESGNDGDTTKPNANKYKVYSYQSLSPLNNAYIIVTF